MFTVVGLLGPTLFQKLLEELDSSVVKDKISTAGVFPVSSILDPLQADFHSPHSNKTVFTRVTDDVFLASSLFSSTLASVFMTPLHLVSAFMILSSNISTLRMLSIPSKLKHPPIGNPIHIQSKGAGRGVGVVRL